ALSRFGRNLCSRIALKHLEIVLFHFIAYQRTKYTTGLDLARVCHWPKYPLPPNDAVSIGLPPQAIDLAWAGHSMSGSKFVEGLYVGSTVIAESGINGSPFRPPAALTCHARRPAFTCSPSPRGRGRRCRRACARPARPARRPARRRAARHRS